MRLWEELKAPHVVDLFPVGLFANGPVLDVGCSSGAVCKLVARPGRLVVGVDVVAGGSTAARGVKLVAASADALPFRSASFDAVCSHAALHHVVLEDGVRESARVVREGGRLALVDFTAGVRRQNRVVVELWRAVTDGPRYVRTYGWSNAVRVLRVRLSPAWLRHIGSDRFETIDMWRRVSGQLPGSVVTVSSRRVRLTWERPAWPDASAAPDAL